MLADPELDVHLDDLEAERYHTDRVDDEEHDDTEARRHRRTNNQPIYPTSHQSSDLILRLHNLQTAYFTEERVDSSLKPATAFFLASPVHSTAPLDLRVYKAGFSPSS